MSIFIFSQPYLNPITKCYSNIITLNCSPKGPLKSLCKNIRRTQLSPFKYCNNLKPCIIALKQLDCGGDFPSHSNELMTVDEFPMLYEFLLTHQYIVDTSVTKMLNNGPVNIGGVCEAKKLICVAKEVDKF
jgi:hypothetical protein